MNTLKTLILTALLCFFSQMALAGAITVNDGWARASIGKARAGIAYLTVQNGGDSADRLIDAAGDVAHKVELHTHIMKDDVMMMRQVESIEVPAGGKAELKPGSYHVMLIGLKAPLKEGESFPLTLTFEKAGPVRIMIHIQKTASMGMKHK
ncbi:MAG: hypothetical protein C0605_07620 [Hyphomicrobiales bacterium]|nr:MAG: hypothetical protein C0605_07620 [Hyphomicrobiales bacterium]